MLALNIHMNSHHDQCISFDLYIYAKGKFFFFWYDIQGYETEYLQSTSKHHYT